MFGQLGGAPTLSSESIRLLQDCIAAPVAKEDGSISYRTPASWGGRDIFVIGSPDAASSDKRTELVRALEERSGGRGALVMLCGEGRDFSFDQVGRHKHVVVKRLRRGMRYLVTGVAGVVAQCFREDDEVEANWNVNHYVYPGWHTQSLSSCIESQDGTIPMVVFDSMEGHFYFGKVVWNARHPVLAPVGTPADGREVIGEAMWRIEHGLLREINRTLERENLNGYWALGVGLPTHAPATFNLASIGLLQKDGDLLPRLREVVGEYWRFLEECGLVGATEACPEISEKDFPWFWNAAPIKFGPVPQVTWNWVVDHDAG